MTTNYNLDSLTYEQLTELEKEIYRQKNLRRKTDGAFYKSELTDERVLKLLIKRFPIGEYDPAPNFSKNSQLALETFPRVHKNILTLCDIALENYKVTNRVLGDYGRRKSIQCLTMNGAIVQKNVEQYKKMHEELLNVFMKYATSEKEGESE